MPTTKAVKPAVNIITRDGLPALNVKVQTLPHWPDAATVAKAYDVNETVASGLLELLWDVAVEQFWQDAETAKTEHFGDLGFVSAEGRFGGWLVVSGLGDVAAWSRKDRQRWTRFTTDIQAAIDYRSSQEWATETLTQILDNMADRAAADRVRDAAPELLLLLQVVADERCQGRIGDELLSQIRAAVAKAEGRTA